MRIKKKTNLKITVSLILVVVLSFFIVPVFSKNFFKVIADNSQNVAGWLWGGSEEGGIPANNTGVGWISMNSTNCDTNDDGVSEGPVGSGCPIVGTSMGKYGVNIPVTNGDLSGYAWSENVGWISFNSNSTDLGGCPDGNCWARVAWDPGTGIGTISGWARIMGIKQELDKNNSGGWQGWIKLHSKVGDQVSYGLEIDSNGIITKGQDTSYAWSDEMGWLDFSRAHARTPRNLSLSVNKTGIGDGSVSFDNPSGKTCSANCSGSYNEGEVVNLTASSTNGSTIAWNHSGCDSIVGDVCVITMNTSKNPTVTFNKAIPCSSDCSCAANTCTGQQCPDAGIGCGGQTCDGTKTCSSDMWWEVVP